MRGGRPDAPSARSKKPSRAFSVSAHASPSAGCEAVQDRHQHRLGSITAIGERAGKGRHRCVVVPGQEPSHLGLGMDPDIQAAIQLERQALTMDRGRVAVLGVGDRTRSPHPWRNAPSSGTPVCTPPRPRRRLPSADGLCGLHERLGEVGIEEGVEQDALFVATSPHPTHGGDARQGGVAVGLGRGRKRQRAASRARRRLPRSPP